MDKSQRTAVPDLQASKYNSTVTIGPDGTILAHYRKSFLYMTDETWATEGSGFFSGQLPLRLSQSARPQCQVAMGICMDINPYKFEAPFDKYEFAQHAVDSGAELVILSMAWSSLNLTLQDVRELASKPDLETLSYWINRFRPLKEVSENSPVILVMGNRCGVEHDTIYAGTSTVLRMSGEKIELWGILGKGQESCLVVDTAEVS